MPMKNECAMSVENKCKKNVNLPDNLLVDVEIRSKDPHNVSKNKNSEDRPKSKSQVSVIIHWRCATPTTSPESNATTNPSPEGGTDPKSGKAVVIMEGPSHHYGVGVPPHQINTPHVAM